MRITQASVCYVYIGIRGSQLLFTCFFFQQRNNVRHKSFNVTIRYVYINVTSVTQITTVAMEVTKGHSVVRLSSI